jgi:hypothetical protein
MVRRALEEEGRLDDQYPRIRKARKEALTFWAALLSLGLDETCELQRFDEAYESHDFVD